MNYDILNNIIDAYIRRNGQQAITGEVLNGVLDMMVSELGSGYQFGGVVTPSTPFEGGDSRLFFLAFEEGVYPSFGGIEVAKGQLAVITYDTEFNAQYIEGLGGGGGVFVAQYGVTTLAEVQSAFAEGLPVFAIRGNALYTLSNSAGADGAYFARIQGTTLYYLTLGESWYFGTIVLPTADDVASVIKYTPQTLTQAQQIQARTNIDAASKAQVTRIALNVGYTDKIKDTATTMRELSERVSIINVLDGDVIAGCILPSSQTGTIGWLYEFEEGWMLTKDISGYVIGEHTWEDLLWYLDANSGKIVNAIRLGLVTGDLSMLTTTDKSTLVAAINEVNADKAASSDLTAEVIRATAAEGALSGEIGNLSSLTTTDKSNLVNAINEVKQGGGGGSVFEELEPIEFDGNAKQITILEDVSLYSRVFIRCVKNQAPATTNNGYFRIPNPNGTTLFDLNLFQNVKSFSTLDIEIDPTLIIATNTNRTQTDSFIYSAIQYKNSVITEGASFDGLPLELRCNAATWGNAMSFRIFVKRK